MIESGLHDTVLVWPGQRVQIAAWFAEHTGEVFTLTSVTEYDVHDWRDHLAAKRKPATVNRKLAVISALFRWARKTGQVEGDPTQYVNGVDQQQTAPKGLSDQNLRRILRKTHSVGSKRDIALLELLAATGLRASEVAGLKIGDVDPRGVREHCFTISDKARAVAGVIAPAVDADSNGHCPLVSAPSVIIIMVPDSNQVSQF